MVDGIRLHFDSSWWRHQMKTFSRYCPFVKGIHGGFPSLRPVRRSFDIFFDLRLNTWLCKPWTRRWFETRSSSLWCHCNVKHGARFIDTQLRQHLRDVGVSNGVMSDRWHFGTNNKVNSDEPQLWLHTSVKKKAISIWKHRSCCSAC